MAVPAKKITPASAAEPQTELSVINNPAPKTPARAAARPKPKLAMVSEAPAAKAEDQTPLWALAALENSRNAVFMCDPEMTITFANKKSIETLTTMEPALHRASDAWRGFATAQVVGSSLSFLFADEPLEFRHACDARIHPYSKQIKVGLCVCDVQVTGIKDGRGELIGYAVEWENVTERTAAEKHQVQLVTA